MSTLKPTLRPTLRFAATACIAVALLVGCGDDPVPVTADDAPLDASVQDFCTDASLVSAIDPDADTDDLVDDLRSNAHRLADAGTPRDIPTQARLGFVIYVESTSTVTEEQVQAGAADPAELAGALGLSADEGRAVAAFMSYAAGTCFTT